MYVFRISVAISTPLTIYSAAFHFEFGALDNSKNEVSEAYENMFVKARMHPSVLDTIFRATWRFFPFKLLEFVKYLPRREYSAPRATRKVIDKVASSLVDQAIQDAQRVEIEKGKKDVMSVLGTFLLSTLGDGLSHS